jgi:hypothetical protein
MTLSLEIFITVVFTRAQRWEWLPPAEPSCPATGNLYGIVVQVQVQLNSVANFWQMISAKSAENFGRPHDLFFGAVLQALLPQVSSKKVHHQFISGNIHGLYVKNTQQKSSDTFTTVFKKSAKNSATVFSVS